MLRKGNLEAPGCTIETTAVYAPLCNLTTRVPLVIDTPLRPIVPSPASAAGTRKSLVAVTTDLQRQSWLMGNGTEPSTLQRHL